MRHMIQHEGGGSGNISEDTDERKPKFVVKGEPANDGNGNEYVVVEVINEEVEYDEGEYELESDQMGDENDMVEVDGTETYKLTEDDNELVSGFDFDEDESSIKN